MFRNPVPASVLGARLIPNADSAFLKALGVPPGHRSLGIFTTDCDDVAYTALDEATKMAEVQVAYAKSMYAGAGNASTRLAGEFLGILSGPGPSEVRSGLDAALAFVCSGASFYSAGEDDSICYFAHCVSRTGSYLSAAAGIPIGAPLAYLIAPPLEAMVGLEAALKAARVSLQVFYGPPTETNFAGGLLTGEQADCRAACEAFSLAVCEVAKNPLAYGSQM